MMLAGCSGGAKNVALIEAADKGNVSEVVRLIADGADVNATALDGWRPLTMAADRGQLDVAAVLIASGADVNGKIGLLSPMYFAARGGHTDVVKLIIDKGGRLDLPPENHETFIRKINSYNNRELLKLLEKYVK